MSDNPDLRICPNCGQENSLYTLCCIRCGEEMEELFQLEGFDPSEQISNDSPQEDQAPLSELLASLDESPLLSEPAENHVDENGGDHAADDQSSVVETELPDWLERVRQRAQEEEDASGELSKIGHTSKERRQVDEAFDDILRRIREQNEREKTRKPRTTEQGMVDEKGDPEWLRRIRELHPKNEDDTRETTLKGLPLEDDDQWTEEELQELLRREMGISEHAGQAVEDENFEEIETNESAKPTIDLPFQENFHNIAEDDQEESQEEEPAEPEEEANAEEPENFPDNDPETENAVDELEEPEGGLHDQERSVEQPDEETAEEAESEIAPAVDNVLPDLLLLRNQRERAQVLREVIEQEGQRTIALLHEPARQGKIGRFVLALMLILAVLGGILFGGEARIANQPIPAAALAFEENLRSITSTQLVLLVLDYHAATRGDIEPLVQEIMAILDSNRVTTRIVTANPENLWLGETPDEFIPGGMLGYLSAAVSSDPAWGQLPLAQVFSGAARIYHEVDQAILISDSSEFVRAWLEQVSPWQSGIQTSVVTTSVSEPMLLPYFESGQLRGVIAGASQFRALDTTQQGSINQYAWQAGTLLMMIVLILGMIMKVDEDRQRRTEERSQ